LGSERAQSGHHGVVQFFVAVSPDDAFVHVTNYSSQTVSVIDASTRTVIRNPITFGRPYAVAVTPDGGHVYVTKTSQDKVSVIDTTINAVVATIPVESTPFGVAVNPAAPRGLRDERRLEHGIGDQHRH
jgi:YVTN family beta-propeller protein